MQPPGRAGAKIRVSRAAVKHGVRDLRYDVNEFCVWQSLVFSFQGSFPSGTHLPCSGRL